MAGDGLKLSGESGIKQNHPVSHHSWPDKRHGLLRVGQKCHLNSRGHIYFKISYIYIYIYGERKRVVGRRVQRGSGGAGMEGGECNKHVDMCATRSWGFYCRYISRLSPAGYRKPPWILQNINTDTGRHKMDMLFRLRA